jgi:predicted dehydrogenase
MNSMHAAPVLAHVGAGRFSRTAHGPALRRLADERPPRVTLDGIADLDPSRPDRARRFCRDFGYRAAHRDLGELMQKVCPDVFVCVVDPLRTAAAVADLLRTGIPVLLEKPPGQSSADAGGLAHLSLTHSTLHYVAFNRRRVPAVESARCWLSNRGTPCYARAAMLRQGRRGPNFAITTGIHAVDTIRYLTGEVHWMNAWVTSSESTSRDYGATLCFESGTRGDIFLSMDSTETRESYVFEYDDSTRAEVTIGTPYSDPSIWAGFRVARGGRVLLEEQAPADRLVAIGIMGEYDAFLHALSAGRQPDCSLVDAWRSMIVAEAMENGYSGSLCYEFSSHAPADCAIC